jgi:hypothetical protein
MNPKCYKSVILAPTIFLLLIELLKRKQQATISATCCKICIYPGILSCQGFFDEFPGLL